MEITKEKKIIIGLSLLVVVLLIVFVYNLYNYGGTINNLKKEIKRRRVVIELEEKELKRRKGKIDSLNKVYTDAKKKVLNRDSTIKLQQNEYEELKRSLNYYKDIIKKNDENYKPNEKDSSKKFILDFFDKFDKRR